MQFKFTDQQLIDIKTELDDAKKGVQPYSKVYDFVFEQITNGDINDPKAAPGIDADGNEADGSVWLWMQGARHINAGEGPYSDFIRDYTSNQHKIRFGGDGLSPEDIQKASDVIAKAVVEDIIDTGELPNIHRIAFQDANGMVSAIPSFNGDEAIWSGNLMFMPLGHDGSFYKNILGEEGETYNLFAAYKATMDANGFETFTKEKIPTLWQTLIKNDYDILSVVETLSALDKTNEFLKETYDGELDLAGLSFQVLIENLQVGTVYNDNAVDNPGMSSTKGADIMHSGDGKDRIVAVDDANFTRDTPEDIFDGGKKTDEIIYNTKLDVKVDLASNTGITKHESNPLDSSALESVDKLHNIENVSTGPGDDDLKGDDKPNVFNPGKGNNKVDGGDNLDTIQYTDNKYTEAQYEAHENYIEAQKTLGVAYTVFDSMVVNLEEGKAYSRVNA